MVRGKPSSVLAVCYRPGGLPSCQRAGCTSQAELGNARYPLQAAGCPKEHHTSAKAVHPASWSHSSAILKYGMSI